MTSPQSGFIDVDGLSDQVCQPYVFKYGTQPDQSCDLVPGSGRPCSHCRIPASCKSVDINDYPILRKYLGSLKVHANETTHARGWVPGTSGPPDLVEQAEIVRDLYKVHQLLDREKREHRDLKRRCAEVVDDDDEASGPHRKKTCRETSMAVVKEEVQSGEAIENLQEQLRETQDLLKERQVDLDTAKKECKASLLEKEAWKGKSGSFQVQAEELRRELQAAKSAAESLAQELETVKHKSKKLLRKNDRLASRNEQLTEKRQQLLENQNQSVWNLFGSLPSFVRGLEIFRQAKVGDEPGDGVPTKTPQQQPLPREDETTDRGGASAETEKQTAGKTKDASPVRRKFSRQPQGRAGLDMEEVQDEIRCAPYRRQPHRQTPLRMPDLAGFSAPSHQTTDGHSVSISDTEPLFENSRADKYLFRRRNEMNYQEFLNGDRFEDQNDPTYTEGATEGRPEEGS